MTFVRGYFNNQYGARDLISAIKFKMDMQSNLTINSKSEFYLILTNSTNL
jgi:hypothetical protein